jgi:hypothetical protein
MDIEDNDDTQKALEFKKKTILQDLSPAKKIVNPFSVLPEMTEFKKK